MDQEQHPAEVPEQQQQDTRKRALTFIRDLVPNQRPTRDQGLRSVRMVVAVAVALFTVLLLLYVIGLLFGITLWNVLKVFAVPITVGAAVPLLNWLQKKRELDVERQRAQDEALQAYLDQMSQLLTDKDTLLHQTKEDNAVRTLARARTLTVLAKLDGSRKWSVLMFLQEAKLISIKDGPVVSLRWANLQGADLGEVVLERADLYETKLQRANLHAANLQDAKLQDAKLQDAKLQDAKLRGADLTKADLSGVNLTEAEVTEEQLATCKSLENAIMPDGQVLTGDRRPDGPTFEEWLKSKDR